MNKNEHPLKNATLKVLEDWAMMLVDEIVEVKYELFDETLPVFMSWVSLHGPINGTVSIVSQKDFMHNLTRNILGEEIEQEELEKYYNDAYREMGNVLAGNFLTEAYGDDVVFDLLDPRVDQIPFSELQSFTQRNIVFSFMADDQPVAVSFKIMRD